MYGSSGRDGKSKVKSTVVVFLSLGAGKGVTPTVFAKLVPLSFMSTQRTHSWSKAVSLSSVAFPVLRLLTGKTGENLFPQTMWAAWMNNAFTMSFAVLGEDDATRIGKCLSTTVFSIVSTAVSTVLMDLFATRFLVSVGR